jgi:hypothetical protein
VRTRFTGSQSFCPAIEWSPPMFHWNRRQFLARSSAGFGAALAAPAPAPQSGTAIDFRYAPLSDQTAFCFPDVGAMRQRVHGVVDVYGARKPSYEVLRVEASPLEALNVSGKAGELKVQLKARIAAPAYALRGYILRTVVYGFGDIPVERFETTLPDIEPGGQTSAAVQFTEATPIRVRLDVLRPVGSSVHTAIWKP